MVDAAIALLRSNPIAPGRAQPPDGWTDAEQEAASTLVAMMRSKDPFIPAIESMLTAWRNKPREEARSGNRQEEPRPRRRIG